MRYVPIMDQMVALVWTLILPLTVAMVEFILQKLVMREGNAVMAVIALCLTLVRTDLLVLRR
jgi:hypothetical protein